MFTYVHVYVCMYVYILRVDQLQYQPQTIAQFISLTVSYMDFADFLINPTIG